jgi:preprotein translocase subunit YajC
MITFEQITLWTLLGAAEAPAEGTWSVFTNPLFPLILIFFVFYFIMIRPERRRRAELKHMLGNLKKNDHVVTVGGIVGTVVNVQQGSEEVTIKVDESTNTKLRVLRSSIARVVGDDDADAKKDATK